MFAFALAGSGESAFVTARSASAEATAGAQRTAAATASATATQRANVSRRRVRLTAGPVRSPTRTDPTRAPCPPQEATDGVLYRLPDRMYGRAGSAQHGLDSMCGRARRLMRQNRETDIQARSSTRASASGRV